jgi:hypothetical protein
VTTVAVSDGVIEAAVDAAADAEIMAGLPM